jgi:hypothetical protein
MNNKENEIKLAKLAMLKTPKIARIKVDFKRMVKQTKREK